MSSSGNSTESVSLSADCELLFVTRISNLHVWADERRTGTGQLDAQSSFSRRFAGPRPGQARTAFRCGRRDD